MTLFLSSLSILFGSTFLILLTGRLNRVSRIIFLISLVTGCLLGMIPAIGILFSPVSGGEDFKLNIHMPIGEFNIGIDPLSAFFLLTITVLFLMAGIYGYEYFKDYQGKDIRVHYALFHLALLSLMLVVTAKDAVLFLMAWEAVTLSSYFLIIFYDAQKVVRDAGSLFLIAAHTGTFCLWIMLFLMAQHTGSLNFEQMRLVPFPLPLAGMIFILGVIGFGVKTGFIPLHIWLPHAHPAAPSHVSAVLSAVMIKMGIYGLMRLIMIIHNFPQWCAQVLLIIGMISGVGGVLYALGQHEIKKLLAYHSIENIGIMTLGLGIGLWGQIEHNALVALIGYAGALLHVFNHAVFKGLLFLSAGSLIRSTHTGEIDRLGGLLKYFPWTGHLFLIGSLAICGLPLFNGFISEWFVFRALFEGMFHLKINALTFSSLGILALALIGGLAAACFAKAFGAIFLGSSRSIDPAHWEENSWGLRAPMIVLGGICLWIGFFPYTMAYFALKGAVAISSIHLSPETEGTILSPLLSIILVLTILIMTIAVLLLFKRIAMKVLPIAKASTWSCGYPAVTSRMQYTASSFAEPILRIFRNILGFNVQGDKPKGYFPNEVKISSHVREASEDFIFRPIFQFINSLSARLKIIQSGFAQVYLLYILIFLLILLVWKMV